MKYITLSVVEDLLHGVVSPSNVSRKTMETGREWKKRGRKRPRSFANIFGHSSIHSIQFCCFSFFYSTLNCSFCVCTICFTFSDLRVYIEMSATSALFSNQSFGFIGDELSDTHLCIYFFFRLSFFFLVCKVWFFLFLPCHIAAQLEASHSTLSFSLVHSFWPNSTKVNNCFQKYINKKKHFILA